MAYRYNVHGSNPPLSIVTVDAEDEDPSVYLFSNIILSFHLLFTGSTKKTDIVAGSVVLAPIEVLKRDSTHHEMG